MRNLKVLSEWKSTIKLESESEELLLSALDVERSRIFFASTANVIYAIDLSASREIQWTINLSMPSDAEAPLTSKAEDLITGLEYLIEQEALIVGNSVGDLLLVVPASNSVEVVGRVEGGVKTIASSPDGALIAVATGFGQLLVMTQDWDVLYEVSFYRDNNLETVMSGTAVDGISHLSSALTAVQVSWRGDGKYFATLGVSNGEGLQQLRIWERETGALHASSEPQVFTEAAMDWMPSGAKVATACDRSTKDKRPSILFFERNGLERGSFDIYGPAEAKIETLKWNCNSELLAALVRCDEWCGIQIWNFSNYHWYLKQEWRYPGKSKLKFAWDTERPMRIICWTADGSVHCLNLCWITAVSDESTALVIDGANVLITPLSLSLMPPPMSLSTLKFQSPVQSVALISQGLDSYLAAGLSDGNISVIKLPVQDAWDQLEGIEYDIAIVDTNNLKINFGNLRHLLWLDSHALFGVIHCDVDRACLSSDLASDEWCQSPSMAERKNGVNILVEIELTCRVVEGIESSVLSSRGWVVKSFKQNFIENSVIAIAANPIMERLAFIQLENGCIIEYSLNEGINMAPAELYKEKPMHLKGFLSCCPWMQVIPLHVHGHLQNLLFGLAEDGRLQANNQIICSNCSGFGFYKGAASNAQHADIHLVYITKQDLLHVVSINEILHGDTSCISRGNDHSQPAFESSFQGNSKNIRKESNNVLKVWERGARLICIINGDEAAIILQTVRGNLESIYPRKLVLLAIAGALVERRFKDAISLVRRHRINFNIIVDYCGWQNFVEVASEFVKQVKNLSHITEFICAIKEENVLDSLYKNVLLPCCLKDINSNMQLPCSISDCSLGPSNQFQNRRAVLGNEILSPKNKVRAVLEAVRKALAEEIPKSPERELCILTTLARNDPPELEEALKKIKKLREAEIASTTEGGGGTSNKANPSAEEALKHLLWLSDPDAVFQAALGLYDLHLAAMVALNSQRDPKEFLPFLQELEQLSPPIMYYTIDCKLQKYENALRNIAMAGDAYFDECLQLMKSNPKLFSLGLEIFKDPEKRFAILEAFGDHLLSEKSFEDAALTYCSCSSFQKALRAFRAGGLWKGTLAMAGMLRLTTEEVLQLANELCEELQALGKPAEAAKIALEYCKDVQSAIGLFVTAREWEEALRIGFMYDTGEFVNSQVKPAAVECANALISEYGEGLEKVGKYLARYLAVRQRRLLLAAKLHKESKAEDDVEDDTASDISSNFSGMSAYTLGNSKGSDASVSPSTVSRSGSARTGMRSQRKPRGGKIRAGSPGEESALVEHLQSMSLTRRAQEELKSLLHVLLLLEEEETARKLQDIAACFQSSQQAAVKQVEDKVAEEQVQGTGFSLDEHATNSRPKGGLGDTFCWQWKVLLPP